LKLKLNGLQLNENARTGVTVDIAMIAKIAPNIGYMLQYITILRASTIRHFKKSFDLL